jgi:ATP-dependent Lhr-like helicase
MLFLAANDDELLRAAGLLLLWSEGFVEPVVPPPAPRHVLAQQLLALCLQENRIGQQTWPEYLAGLPLGSAADAEAITAWMLESGHLDTDSGMLFVGPEAERRYGRRHFLELLSVFTSDPQFTILHGRTEIGAVDPMVLTRRVEGPRVLSLAGRSWEVGYIDWKRRRAFVEPSATRGMSRWSGSAQPLSYALTDAMRRVLLGADPPGTVLSRRAVDRLAAVREDLASTASPGATVVAGWDAGQVRWWTWAGARTNGLLATALSAVELGLVDELERYDNRYVRLRGDATPLAVRTAIRDARRRFGDDLRGIQPAVSDEAVRQLKFAELLPPDLSTKTLAARTADHAGAEAVIRQRIAAG